MAHGLLCVTCGFQETPHIHPEYLPEGANTCQQFDDGIKHLKDCPRTSCAGNCRVAIRQENWEATRAAHNAQNTLASVRDRKGALSLVVLDIGT